VPRRGWQDWERRSLLRGQDSGCPAGPGVYLRWAYSSSKAAQWTGRTALESECTAAPSRPSGRGLHGGRLDDQLATCPRVEERGLDDGTRLDPEEVGDLSDDGGRGDDRTAEPPEQRGARLWCLSLALSIATSGLVSAISIGTLRELLMLDVLRALGQVRRDLSRGSRSWPPHSQVRLQRADECWIVVFLEDDRRRVQHVRRGGSHQLNHAG
jgi:hypothetical protein